MSHIIEVIETITDYTAILILVIGGVKSFINLIRIEINSVEGRKKALHKDIEKVNLSSYILLSIQFMIISDLIRTVTSDSFKTIMYVSILIIIRGITAKLVVQETTVTKQHIADDEDN